jgi:hypothetical protein
MALAGKSGHKKMVNKLLTLLAFSLLPLPAAAAVAEVQASVTILAPSAAVTPIPPEAIRSRPLKGPGLAFQGAPGQVIGYSAGGVSGVVALDKDGLGRFILPKSLPANVEITLHYD